MLTTHRPAVALVLVAAVVATASLAPPSDAAFPEAWAVGVTPLGADAARDAVVAAGGRVLVDARDAGFLIITGLSARAAQSVSLTPGVRYVAPDAPASAAAVADAVPDVLAPMQWNLAAVNASAAWALLPGPQPITVAVVDSGADLAHADLVLNYWDGNALHGVNVGEPFGAFRALPMGGQLLTTDETGHGTMVAGVVAATRGNGVGVAGVADVPVMVVKTTGLGAPATVTSMAAGIVWAVDHGARVVSVSQTAPLPHPALTDAVAYAERSGVVVVAAAGNNGQDRVYYPAAYGTVVSVGAVDASDDWWPSTTHGKVDVAAPGVDVLTTALGNGYAWVTGTSFATPHASAVAALVLAADPALSPAGVRAALNATARDVHEPGRDAGTGHGVVDAGAAVAHAMGQQYV